MTQQPAVGSRVSYTIYGRKGTFTGILNGYELTWTGETVAWIRSDTGNTISVSITRVA